MEFDNMVNDNTLLHYGRSKADGAPGVGTGNWRKGLEKAEKISKRADKMSRKAARSQYRAERDTRMVGNPLVWVTGFRDFATWRASVNYGKLRYREQKARKLAEKGRKLYNELQLDTPPDSITQEERERAQQVIASLMEYGEPAKRPDMRNLNGVR